jgi:hypothetical protein
MRGFVGRRRASHVLLEQPTPLGHELLVVARREVGALECFDRRDERFGHVAPPEIAEIAAGVRIAT